jgi:hypothetical protein
MNRPVIIGLSSKKSGGKDTAFDYIKSIIPDAVEFRFSDPIKEFAINMLGLTPEQVHGSEAEKNSYTKYSWEDMPLSVRIENTDGVTRHWPRYKYGPMTAREVVQYWATEIFRSVCPSIHIDRFDDRIQKCKAPVVCVLDLRFPDEMQYAIDNDWKTLRFTRSISNDQHYSEIALDRSRYNWTKFSGVVDNRNLSLDDKNKEIHQYLINWGLTS